MKVNNQLEQLSSQVVSSSNNPDPTYPSQSTKGVIVLRMVVRNEGVGLRNVVFKVASLPNNNYLLNADSGPGQAGSKLSIPNANLPGGNQLWNDDENLTQDFRVGLQSRNSFVLLVDVYAVKMPMAAATPNENNNGENEELIDSFSITIDPEAEVDSSYRLFLPAVSR